MRSRVIAEGNLVPTLCDNRAIADDHRAEWTAGIRAHFFECKRSRALHECLFVAYGMEAEGFAQRIGRPAAVVDHAVLTGSLSTVFGWPIHVGENFNPRSLRNYLM